MPVIEFALSGPPFSSNRRKGGPKQTKNRRKWVEAVQNSARASLPDGYRPIVPGTHVFVTIQYWYRENYRDVDNILKSILDALGRDKSPLVWEDDKVVNRLLVERYYVEPGQAITISNRSAVLAGALKQHNEVVYVRIEWEQL